VRRTALNQTDNLLEMKQEVTTSQLSWILFTSHLVIPQIESWGQLSW
jgi:hypothetical protein